MTLNWLRGKISSLANSVELQAFLGYALIVFRPGATPPKHPQAALSGPTRVPEGWAPEEFEAYIDEARRNMDAQLADKRDIRARAQIILTTTLVLGGAIAASYASKGDVSTLGLTLYLLAAGLTGLTALASGGLITAQAPIGGPNVQALLTMRSGMVTQRLAEEYAASRHEGAATVAMLVTVLRDCVLALLLGAGALGIAHIWS